MATFQAEIGRKRTRKREIKITVPFRSCRTRAIKFQKNSEKIQKIEKYRYGYISSQNRTKKDDKKRNKNYRSISFLHDG